MVRRVEVVPYDPAWSGHFAREAERIESALGPNAVAVHHIGSTAIPGMLAKPIVDLLVEVRDIAGVDAHAASMEALGYEPLGEYGIPGRRFFRRNDAGGNRTHHVHVFAAACADVVRHLCFRDFMRAHPEWAKRYSELKRELARAHPEDIDAYMDGKDAFIKEGERRALAWRKQEAPTDTVAGPRIETADLTDAVHCAALVEIVDTYARGPGGQNAPLGAEASARLAQGLLDHPCATVLLAWVDRRAVGVAVCVWGFSTFAGKPTVNVHDLAVLPDFQGRGIGRALLGEVERLARDRECAKMTLEVHDTNDGAKRLYRSFGFGTWDSPTLFVTKPL